MLFWQAGFLPWVLVRLAAGLSRSVAFFVIVPWFSRIGCIRHLCVFGDGLRLAAAASTHLVMGLLQLSATSQIVDFRDNYDNLVLMSD
jgi:hypothetical protein